RFTPIFEASVDADAIVRPRSLHPQLAQRPGDVEVGDLLRGLTFDNAKDVHVIDGGLRWRPEVIVGNAGRISVVEHRAAFGHRTGGPNRDDHAGRWIDIDDVDRVGETPCRELVLVNL